LLRQLRAHRKAIASAREAIICSVVPGATARIAQALRHGGLRRVRVVGRDVKVPLKNRYKHPKQVGQDRLVGAYDAWRRYRTDCIVVDFGTAITIDLVTRTGEYLGGAIAPGLELSLEALASRTALLPRVGLRAPSGALGRDTASSIRAGIVYGAAALCDGLVGRLKRRYAPRATVVATGGSSRFLARYATSIHHVRPFLVLEGLQSLAGIPNSELPHPKGCGISNI
jgi:type III pantothenate kinase